MVMTAFAVHVTVGHFFFACITDSHDLHIEVQALTGQRVVTDNCSGCPFRSGPAGISTRQSLK